MATGPAYLRQNVIFEPLVNKWYAWTHLIPPLQAAMFMAHLHRKILQSFINNPQIHVSASKNPAMAGGPFINYDDSKVADVRAHLETTLREQAHMLELAEAIKAINCVLTREAIGYSLEPLYEKIPEALKGYVELVYDLDNNPSLRFLEGLLYKSPYYNRELQGMVLSLCSSSSRPFTLSTPKLDATEGLQLAIPFDCPRLDAFFRMRHTPDRPEQIADELSVESNDKERFFALFTEEPPADPSKYLGEGIRVRYFGHACVLIETRDTAILCDPLISYKCEREPLRYTYTDLPEVIDYALITHGHSDHCNFETLLQLRHKIGTVIVPRNSGGTLVDPSLKLILQMIGFNSVKDLEEMESVLVKGGAITALPFLGEHADLSVRTKSAYLITLEGKSILCAADSNNVEPRLYDHIHEQVGDVDLIFLGMECVGAPLSWLYGPLLTKPLSRKMDQSRRFNGSDSARAIEMVKRLNPSMVFVYAMGEEPWLSHVIATQYTEESVQITEARILIEYCKSIGVASERLYFQKELFL